jgi:formamidopyrimidine-DNA glycosylase
MYDAKIHPEQYSDTLSAAQIEQLHKSIQYVCNLAVETKADSSQFPEHWLFNHRWGKGKKDSTNVLPNGAKIVFLKVGGRTSAVIPSVQKKTGKVAGDVKDEGLEDDEGGGSMGENGEEVTKTPTRKKKQTGKVKRELKADDVVENTTNGDAQTVRRKSSKGTARVSRTEIKKEQIPKGSKRKAPIEETEETTVNGLDDIKAETELADEAESTPQPAKKRKAPKKVQSKRANKRTENITPIEKAQSERSANEPTPGRRRSARVSGVGP